MARPKTKEDSRRDEIVNAALHLVLTTGYNQVTLADIAEEVGVSKGLISYYFSKKEDVFLAVLDLIADRLTSDTEGCYRAAAPAPEKLKMVFNNLFGNEKRARRYYTVLIDYMAQAIREPRVQEYTQHIYNSYRAYMELIISEGVRDGEFRAVDPHRSASMAIGMMEGLALQWFFDKKAFDLEGAYETCVDWMNVYLMPDGKRSEGKPIFMPPACAPPAVADVEPVTVTSPDVTVTAPGSIHVAAEQGAPQAPSPAGEPAGAL